MMMPTVGNDAPSRLIPGTMTGPERQWLRDKCGVRFSTRVDHVCCDWLRLKAEWHKTVGNLPWMGAQFNRARC